MRDGHTPLSRDVLDILFDQGMGKIGEILEDQTPTNADMYRISFDALMEPAAGGSGLIQLRNNQRDPIKEVYARLLNEHMPEGGHMVCHGGGDGQTIQLVFPALSAKSATVHSFDPTPGYSKEFEQRVIKAGITPGAFLKAGFQEIRGHYLGNAPITTDLPREADVTELTHSIYFGGAVDILETAVEGTKEGGLILMTFADEMNGITGNAVKAFRDTIDETDDADVPLKDVILNYEKICNERINLLTGAEPGMLQILKDRFNARGIEIELKPVYSQRFDTRFFHEDMAGIINYGNITVLAPSEDEGQYDGLKALSTADMLYDRGDQIGLSVYFDDANANNPRNGMLSVEQPEYIVAWQVVRKSPSPQTF